jgi:pimeloyl-ACP methyl ester carboxylesterase
LAAIVKNPACVDSDLRAALLRNLFKEGRQHGVSRHYTQHGFERLRTAQVDLGPQPRPAEIPFDMPMVILHGRQDAVVPLKHSEHAAKLARSARLIVLEDCGHTPQIEQPAEFNTALSAFARMLFAVKAA